MPIYMQFEGVKGPIQRKGFEGGLIELESAQLGTHRHITNATGQGANREANVPSTSEITITKLQDSASTALFRESLGGTGRKVTILFVKEDGTIYMKLTLENTMISSYNLSGHGGGTSGKPLESLNLNFTSIEYERGTEDLHRTQKQQPDRAVWDLAQGTGA
jgi:type VI secretion system secreted protein Hcp